jgi:hypothetical protein
MLEQSMLQQWCLREALTIAICVQLSARIDRLELPECDQLLRIESLPVSIICYFVSFFIALRALIHFNSF